MCACVQCDQIGRSWNVFGDNIFFQKLTETCVDFLGYFENVTFYAKIVMASFGQHLGQIGLFMQTFGHTSQKD